ncbi:hypothetical protein AAG570_012701 [Ranatra chinensis]|uniref:Neurochondrin n=1 Tax=Ranatra chinensis TaxID=642074 RepID=A0ABD0YTA4_9HEMI
MGDVPDSVKKCTAILKSAKNDTEKFAALFMVTKLIKGSDCNVTCKQLLADGIGFDFLKRLLTTEDVEADCPARLCRSVALSVLSSLAREPTIASRPDMLSFIPIFFDIIKQNEDDEYDENLMLVTESYECLEYIAAVEPGLKALLDAGAVCKMSEIYSVQCFQTDVALRILVTLVARFGPAAWDSTDPKPFNTLMNKIALDFETDHSERKFELCGILEALMNGCPKDIVRDSCSEESWPMSIYKGLHSILTGKLGKSQRDPALKLASAIIDLLGVEWSMSDPEKPKQFFLLLLHLYSVEIRMQLEDRSFVQIMKNAGLVTCCFHSLELAVTHLASDSLELDQKEKQQLYTALKGAFSAVISTINKLSSDLSKGKIKLEVKEKLFVCAMVRVLAAWLAQETSAMRNALYDILPFLFNFSNESFYAHRSQYIADKVKTESKMAEDEELDPMCHFAIEDRGRQIMLECKQDQVLLECFTFHWSIVHYKKPPVPKSERLKVKKGPEPALPQKLLEQMKDSRVAMISMCNIFMNITVLEPKLAETSSTFNSLLKFVMNNLPELKAIEENLVLHGNMVILGLLLLKQQAKKVDKNDFSICLYIQSVIRFLWDAYTVDESAEFPSLAVSMSYKKYWMELMELWFLGMQTMSAVVSLIPWISEFAIESGWAQGIMDSLKSLVHRPRKALPPNVKSAYEDFLCNLVDANPNVAEVLKEHDALGVCRTHLFMELGRRLFGD